jgi:predicted secreted protein
VWLTLGNYGGSDRMTSDDTLGRRAVSRRVIIAGASTLLVNSIIGGRHTHAQQIMDTRGFDPLWRNAEEAVLAFFGRVTYDRSGIELDLPQHAEVGSSVPLTLRIAAGMTNDDYPQVVHVVASGNPTPHVLSAWFTPSSGKAEFSTRIRLERSQKVTAVAQMRDGRHLRADRDVSVSFGACAQIGTGTNDDIAAFEPSTRVNVPTQASRDSVVPIRAVISHPQETGLRMDAFQEWVRQRIISRFGCVHNDAEVFRARLYPAVATNPYFSFFVRAEQSGTFQFSWYDTTDKTYTHSAEMTVVP